eukprot:g3004.t1
MWAFEKGGGFANSGDKDEEKFNGYDTWIMELHKANQGILTDHDKRSESIPYHVGRAKSTKLPDLEEESPRTQEDNNKRKRKKKKKPKTSEDNGRNHSQPKRPAKGKPSFSSKSLRLLNMQKSATEAGRREGAKRARDAVLNKLSKEVFMLKKEYNERYDEVLAKRKELDILTKKYEKDRTRKVEENPFTVLKEAKSRCEILHHGSDKEIRRRLGVEKVTPALIEEAIEHLRDAQRKWFFNVRSIVLPPHEQEALDAEVQKMREAQGMHIWQENGVHRTEKYLKWDVDQLMMNHLPEEIVIIPKQSTVEVTKRMLENMLRRLKVQVMVLHGKTKEWKDIVKTKAHKCTMLSEEKEKAIRAREVCKVEKGRLQKIVQQHISEHKLELDISRAELEAMEKWKAVDESISARRTKMRAEIQGKLLQEEMQKSILVSDIRAQVQKKYTEKEKQALEPFKKAAKMIWQETGVVVESLLEAYNTQGIRLQSLRDDHKSSKIKLKSLMKTLKEMKEKLKEMQYYGVDTDRNEELVIISDQLADCKEEKTQMQLSMLEEERLYLNLSDGIQSLYKRVSSSSSLDPNLSLESMLRFIEDSIVKMEYELVPSGMKPIKVRVATHSSVANANVQGNIEEEEPSTPVDVGDHRPISEVSTSKGSISQSAKEANVYANMMQRMSDEKLMNLNPEEITSKHNVRVKIRKVRSKEPDDGRTNRAMTVTAANGMELFIKTHHGHVVESDEEFDEKDEEEDVFADIEQGRPPRRTSIKSDSLNLINKVTDERNRKKKRFKNAANMKANMLRQQKDVELRAEEKRRQEAERERQEKINRKKAKRAGVNHGRARQEKIRLAKEARRKREGGF